MVELRGAAPADAGEVVRIRIRSWQHAYAGIVPADVLDALDEQYDDQVRQLRDRWSSPAPRPYRTVVAAEGGELVGFASFGPYRLARDGSEWHPRVGEVLAIYVHPDRTGGGAGRLLMDAAVAGLREAGMDAVRLWVLEGNTPARRFYERYGFRADGERHTFPVTRPDGSTVELPEVRYTMPLA